jgi:hypothetical protein
VSSVIPDANNNIAVDPDFVGTTKGDFHLRLGSPCIDSGFTTTTIDMGAYGDTGADTVPFKVSGVTTAQTSDTSVTVTWSKNLDYKVTGYRVWYGKTAGGTYGGTEAAEGASPISVPTDTSAATELTYLLSGLTTTVITPDAPVITQTSPLDRSLSVSWSPVAGATKYKVYYSASASEVSSMESTSLFVQDATSVIIPDLINEVTYYVGVTAISETALNVAVTAVYAGTPFDPGISNESIHSEEASVGAGEGEESALSVLVFDYPEALVAYPNLPDSSRDCFFATAAYGHYSAPQVQALRAFRDRYLLTNRPGSAFVRWYYEYGPVAAAYLDTHPGYKPVVRAALLPAVGTALFMTSTPLSIKVVVTLFLLILVLMTAYLSFRKRLSGSGGAH